MSSTVNINLKPLKATILSIIAFGIMSGLFLLGILNPNNVSTREVYLPIFIAIFCVGIYLIIKLSTYRLLLCDDRIIKKVLWKREEILYSEIDELIVDGASFDAYQIGKMVSLQAAKAMKKYQIFDVVIVSGKREIFFRTKWFDPLEQVSDALSFLVKKCPSNKLKFNRNNDSNVQDFKMFLSCPKWIIIIGILAYIIDFLFF